MKYFKTRLWMLVVSLMCAPCAVFLNLSKFDSSLLVFVLFPTLVFALSISGIAYIFSPELPDGLLEKDLWCLNMYSIESPLLPWHAAGWNVLVFGFGVMVISIFKVEVFQFGALFALIGIAQVVGNFLSLKLFKVKKIKRPESGL